MLCAVIVVHPPPSKLMARLNSSPSLGPSNEIPKSFAIEIKGRQKQKR